MNHLSLCNLSSKLVFSSLLALPFVVILILLIIISLFIIVIGTIISFIIFSCSVVTFFSIANVIVLFIIFPSISFFLFFIALWTPFFTLLIGVIFSEYSSISQFYQGTSFKDYDKYVDSIRIFIFGYIVQLIELIMSIQSNVVSRKRLKTINSKQKIKLKNNNEEKFLE